MNSLDTFFSTPFSLALDFGFILALSIFLFLYFRSRDKNNAYIMVIVLTISYIGYPLLNIYTFLFVTNENLTRLQGSITVALNVFNLYWTMIYALYIYRLSKSILDSRRMNFISFFVKSLLFCGVLTSLMPILIYQGVWGDSLKFIVTKTYTIGYYIEECSSKLSYLIIRDGLCRLCPTLATSICYYKLYYLLKDSKAIVCFSGPALRRLFWSSVLPVVCSLPGILNDISNVFQPFYLSFYTTFVILSLRYYWEFLNLWAYWKLNPTAVGRERIETCVALNSTFELEI